MLEPLDFLARLAALVPPPRMHLTRYHGVFAASIEDPALIERILAHRESRDEPEHEGAPFASRAPPPQAALV